MSNQKPDNKREISKERKALYYGGMALMGVGFLLFISVFFTGFSRMNSPLSMMEGPGFMSRGIVGIVLIAAGAVLRGVGARGTAGSGLVLDPKKARDDLAPYTDALGGMARDAVDAFKGEGEPPEEQKVMVRCRACRALNDETAKFCSQCGAAL